MDSAGYSAARRAEYDCHRRPGCQKCPRDANRGGAAAGEYHARSGRASHGKPISAASPGNAIRNDADWNHAESWYNAVWNRSVWNGSGQHHSAWVGHYISVHNQRLHRKRLDSSERDGFGHSGNLLHCMVYLDRSKRCGRRDHILENAGNLSLRRDHYDYDHRDRYRRKHVLAGHRGYSKLSTGVTGRIRGENRRSTLASPFPRSQNSGVGPKTNCRFHKELSASSKCATLDRRPVYVMPVGLENHWARRESNGFVLPKSI